MLLLNSTLVLGFLFLIPSNPTPNPPPKKTKLPKHRKWSLRVEQRSFTCKHCSRTHRSKRVYFWTVRGHNLKKNSLTSLFNTFFCQPDSVEISFLNKEMNTELC